MPIKFRCQHCRQFLGISRSRAGSMVDCPTCGRSVRVPELDGKVAPVPKKPRLNLADSALVSALDQLASIGSDVPDHDDAPAAAVAAASAIAASPVRPTPQPVVVEAAPLSPVVVVEPEPAPIAKRVATPRVGEPQTRPAASVGASAQVAGIDAASQSSGTVALQELARDAPGTVDDHMDRRHSRFESRPGVRHARLPHSVVGLIAVSCLLTGITIGVVAGRTLFLPATTGNDDHQAASGDVHADAAADAVDVHPGQERSGPPSIAGRVTYRTQDGETREDRGARVIALPQQRSGEARLSVIGFRSADAEADAELAALSLRFLGGDVAAVADDGTYELYLPAAGHYEVLIVSRFQSRPADEVLPGPVRNLLSKWFDRGDQLLGQLSYRHTSVRFRGDGTEIQDCLFGRQ